MERELRQKMEKEDILRSRRSSQSREEKKIG